MKMSSTTTVILNQQEIANKIRRIAYQIYETNTEEQQVIIAGIKKNGLESSADLKEENFAIMLVKLFPPYFHLIDST